VDDVALSRERMPPPRLVVAAHQRLVGGLQEQHVDVVAAAPQLLDGLHHVGEVLALPHVDPQRDGLHAPARVRAQLRERRDQGGGQVVHAEVAQVLEALDRVALPRAREAGDDDEADGLGGDGLGHALSASWRRAAAGATAGYPAPPGTWPPCAARSSATAPAGPARSPGRRAACCCLPRSPCPGSSSSPTPTRPWSRSPRRCRCGRRTSARTAPAGSGRTCWW